MNLPYLTDAEIAEICAPLTQPAAQVKALVAMGFTVKKKPNGRPLVSREHFEAVMGAHLAAPATANAGQPDEAGMVLRFRRKPHQGGQNGPQAPPQPARAA